MNVNRNAYKSFSNTSYNKRYRLQTVSYSSNSDSEAPLNSNSSIIPNSIIVPNVSK